MCKRISPIGLSLFLICKAAVAQYYPQQPSPSQYPPQQQQANPNNLNDPGGEALEQINPEDRNHGVVRVSLLNGDVSLRRGDSGDQVAAALNAPLLAMDALVTGPSSRAEIQVDTANRIRLANDTDVRLSEATADYFQIQIGRGMLTWSVSGQGRPGEIASPSVAIRALGAGSYRVTVLPDGTTQVTVRAGALDVTTPRGVERVAAGQTMLARGAVENPEFQVNPALPQDEWDVFNERRDSELQRSQSYNYVSRDIAGAEDLDNYGQWNNDSTYGQVWTPRVASDWAPYRLGRWAYEDYYGWTWISSDPWGWAPYHYGSWFRGSYGWSWYPGPRYSHYYYRPALVSFFGFGGGGVGIGFSGGWGFGNVGWVPLAPFERFNRWYGRGSGGFGGGFGRNINVASAYRNARTFNGATSMSSRDFAGGHFGRYSTPNAGQLQQAGLSRGGVPFSPTNNHFRLNDRQTAVQGRTNFGQTRFGGTSASRQNVQAAPRATTQQNFGNFGNGGSSNWDRFGSPGSQAQPASRSQYQQQFQGRSSSASNWQRFGTPDNGRQNVSPSGSASYGSQRQFGSSQQNFQRFGSQSVQVAPPLVRERSYGSSSSNSRGQTSSQPRSESRGSSNNGSTRGSSRPEGRQSTSGNSGNHHDSGSRGARR